uniref:PspC domain-containing protein n=1 Tax=candidate division CPR3 bacterium TaxID=2268181 RepID=A0A7C4M326_UNCC3
MKKNKKLFRSTKDRFIAGVCGGLGEYFEVDSTLVRVVFVLLLIMGGFPGILTYIILWAIMPEK